MAQKVTVEIASDLSGMPEASKVDFGWDGTSYEIDLTAAEREELANFLSRYVEAGHKASADGGKRGRPKASGAVAGSGLNPDERKAVRDYAAANGVTLAARGRLPELAVTAWRTQNPAILEHLRDKQAA
jgi:nucleoid-associated protein Lsr2